MDYRNSHELHQVSLMASAELTEDTSRDQLACIANLSAHRPGISRDEVIQAYNKWALSGEYEQDLSLSRYRGPMIAADTVSKYFKGNQKTMARVLDIAAGTGFVGEQLELRGFHNLDALEPAEEMLVIAKNKGIYKNCICETLGDNCTNIQDDTYDAVVTSGGMGEGHIPCSSLKELIRITKPNGIVCLVMREEYLSIVKEYKDRLEPYMDQLEDSGYWKGLQRTVVPQYSFSNNGVVFVYKVLISGSIKQHCDLPL